MPWIRLKVDSLARVAGGQRRAVDRSFRTEDVEFVDHLPDGSLFARLRSGAEFAVKGDDAGRLLAGLEIPPDGDPAP